MDQDPDKPSGSGRKVRFAPKAPPPSRQPKVTAPTPVPRPESKHEDPEAEAQRLLRQFNMPSEPLSMYKQDLKVGMMGEFKPAASQVAFGAGDSSSPSIKSFGPRREVSSAKGTESEIIDSTSDERQIVNFSPVTAREDRSAPISSDASSTQKIKEDYKEPWNYDTYYPTTLPWRKPNSGDPEVLDQEEFGENTRNSEYDENSVNSAADLGLLDESENRKLFFFQLPKKLPLDKRPASTKGKEKAESSKPLGRTDAPKDLDLSKLPGGYMGKMLVYKSGAVKFKLGDTLFDVSAGSDCSFAQDLVVMDVKDKTCCVLGQLDKLAVVSPDIDSFLKP
ncbi:RNA polymerase III RPC4 [Citrus sinensis]|uniref:RNA polymerase III RPC4 n=2 Tax=Citrus sinensis TaxID=2711 RepID=A0ACB8HUN9_CITSI|nr:RNA polymerase III RPC4 [Citrus sinensis]